MTARETNREPPAEMYARLRASGLITRLLELARDEDLYPTQRDVTSAALGMAAATDRFEVRFRDSGVVSGLVAIPEIIATFSVDVAFSPHIADGDAVDAGALAGVLAGNAADVVLIERTVLNLVGRLSGIATRTALFADTIRETGAVVCDTRKTTPGLRAFEKYAVVCGGGTAHRFSLGDAVLIKDNHIAGISRAQLTKRLTAAAERAKSFKQAPAFFQVEVDTLEQLDEVLAVGPGLVDFVLLDNFSNEQLREACVRRERSVSRPLFEASGGVTLGTIRAIAETGVERISVGGLTHHAVSLDVGLDAATP